MAIEVAINHRTSYTYDRLVTLSPHIIRLRPAPHCRTSVSSYALRIQPSTHFLNWQQDPHGNYLARTVFPERTRQLTVEVDLVAELTVINPFDFFLEPSAEEFPFSYEKWLAKDLRPYLKKGRKGRRLRKFVESIDLTPRRTVDFLFDLNHRVSQHIDYVIRMKPGVQTSEQTLKRRSGSCRDSAWLLAQTLRRLGLASRFVSGYLIQLVPDQKPIEGPEGPQTDFTDLHAWKPRSPCPVPAGSAWTPPRACLRRRAICQSWATASTAPSRPRTSASPWAASRPSSRSTTWTAASGTTMRSVRPSGRCQSGCFAACSPRSAPARYSISDRGNSILASLVTKMGGDGGHLLSPPLSDAVAQLRRRETREELAAVEYQMESPLAPRGTAFTRFADTVLLPDRSLLEGTTALMELLYRQFEYDPVATTVSTPVADVLDGRRGVCQDFAPLMIACLRSRGVPARYVSGYLVPRPGIVGGQASHAWVSAYCPGVGGVDFDPTNNVIPSNGHITLAWGRDFEDVSPFKGVTVGGGNHTVSVHVQLSAAEGDLP